MSQEAERLQPGSRLGNLRIGGLLGRGSMGSVHAAIDERLHRRVAVKAISGPDLVGEARRRFLIEAHLLSRLDHPNICRLYDYLEEGDTGRNGTYLILERIEGRTLTHRVRRELSYGQKLSIAEQIAAALGAAHAQGIVHRDLKPGNVMLTPKGQVKVLDFGLARLVARPPGDEDGTSGESASSGNLISVLNQSAEGLVVGTPSYMSPEQAQGKPVTPASDVYSFALLLQELFTGSSAYGNKAESPHLLEIVRRGKTLPANGVGSDLALLFERMKSKDDQDRPSIDEVARELQVIRRRPARRRRRALIGAVTIAFVLGGLKYALDFRRERNEALAARQEAESVSDFLVELFHAPSPYASAGAARGQPLTALELLHRGSQKIRQQLHDQPMARARLMTKMAQAFLHLNELREAEALFNEALALESWLHGERSLEVAAILNDLGTLRALDGELDRAEELIRQALELRREQGAQSALLARSVLDFGQVLASQGRMDLAEERIREALTIYRRAELLDTREYQFAACRLANLLFATTRLEEAAATGNEILNRVGHLPDEYFEAVLATRVSLTKTYRELGDLNTAEEHGREALAMSERAALGDQHFDSLQSLLALAEVLGLQGETDEAQSLAQRAVDAAGAIGAETESANYGLLVLAELKFRGGDFTAAEALAQQARALGQERRDAAIEQESGLLLARLRFRLGDPVGAREILQRVRESCGQSGVSGLCAGMAGLLAGQLALDRGQLEQAEDHVRAALERLQAIVSEPNWRILKARSLLTRVLLAQGRPEEAEAHWRPALDVSRRSMKASAPLRLEIETLAREAPSSRHRGPDQPSVSRAALGFKSRGRGFLREW